MLNESVEMFSGEVTGLINTAVNVSEGTFACLHWYTVELECTVDYVPLSGVPTMSSHFCFINSLSAHLILHFKKLWASPCTAPALVDGHK